MLSQTEVEEDHITLPNVMASSGSCLLKWKSIWPNFLEYVIIYLFHQKHQHLFQSKINQAVYQHSLYTDVKLKYKG